MSKAIEFRWFGVELLKVASGLAYARHRHAPLDPARQRACLVQGEIMTGLRPDKAENLQEWFFGTVGRVRIGGLKTVHVFDKRGGDLCDRQDAIRLSGLDCTLRHAVECRLGRLLDDDEPALAFHRLQAFAAVRAAA